MRAPTRHGMPDTSYEAAESVNVSREERLVLNSLYDDSESTDEQIYDDVHALVDGYATPQGLRSRRCELMRKGFIEVADSNGITSYGRRCRRYRLTKKGRELCKTLF